MAYSNHLNGTPVCNNYSNHYNHSWGDGCSKNISRPGGGHNSHSSHSSASHNNHSIVAPSAYPLPISSDAPNKWVRLRDAVPDLKVLRNEIIKLSTTKVSSTGVPITTTPVPVQNTDEKLAPGQPALRAQINETISQIDNLWGQIKGGSSGLSQLPTGALRRKSDYKTIIEKAQELANTSQPPSMGYSNHTNYSY